MRVIAVPSPYASPNTPPTRTQMTLPGTCPKKLVAPGMAAGHGVEFSELMLITGLGCMACCLFWDFCYYRGPPPKTANRILAITNH